MVAHCDRLVDEFIPSRGSEQAKIRTGGDLFRINSSSSRCPEDVINCRALPSSAAVLTIALLACHHAIRVNINKMKELAEFINVGNLFVIIKMIFKFQFNPPIPSWLRFYPRHRLHYAVSVPISIPDHSH